MMTFIQVKNVRYYIELALDDYYHKGGEPAGQSYGLGAAVMGLRDEISEENYLDLMNGIHPRTKELLYQQNGKNHRSGYDLTFNASKSFSLVVARADEQHREELLNANKKAVKKALNFLEQKACYTRRGKNGIKHEKTIGLVATLFEHMTNRETEPHAHIHAIVHNCSPRVDGSFGTIEARYLAIWGKTATSIYQANLAQELRALGYDTEQNGRAVEVARVDINLRDHFSTRTKQIQKHMESLGLDGARAANISALATRKAKGMINRDVLFPKWQSQLDKLGFSKSVFEKVRRKSLGIHLSDHFTLDTTDAVKRLESVLTVTKNTVKESEIYDTAIQYAMHQGLPASHGVTIAEEFILSDLCIELESGDRQLKLFTTKEVLEREKNLINDAKSLSSHRHALNASKADIQKAESKLGITLSEEQSKAVEQVLQHGSLKIISGSAGAGKSKATEVLKEVCNRYSIEVHGTAIAKSAAKNLQFETGIKSQTVQSLINQLEEGTSKVKKGDVLVIDEAGQLGTAQATYLITAALRQGFKIIMVGEDKQLDAIEHGGVLSYLSNPEVIGTSRIETIRRQRESWDKEAVGDLRDGHTKRALEAYAKHDRFHVKSTRIEAQHNLIDDWFAYQSDNPNKQSMMLAHSWKEVKLLNQAAREKLKESELLGNENIPLKGINGKTPFNFLVSKNERVRFTKNDYRLDFTNGDTGIVKNIVRRGKGVLSLLIEKDDGSTVTVNTNEYADEKGQCYLIPSYAQTIYSSQGLTIEGNVYVLNSPFMSRKTAYVAMSRHKDECHLYLGTEDLSNYDNGQSKKMCKEKILSDLSKQYATDNRAKLAVSYKQVKKEKEIAVENQIELDVVQ